MRYLSITCSKCHTCMRYTEFSILSKKSLECPCCHKKMQAPFFRKLKSDIKYHQEHTDFEISSETAPAISLSKLTQTAMDKALLITYDHYHKQHPDETMDDFSDRINKNDLTTTLSSTFAHQLLRQYHLELMSQLSAYNIFLGELED